jgi:hypothetical protein
MHEERGSFTPFSSRFAVGAKDEIKAPAWGRRLLLPQIIDPPEGSVSETDEPCADGSMRQISVSSPAYLHAPYVA